MRAFVPNKGFEAEIAGQADYTQGLLQIAEDIKVAAEAIGNDIGAPWMPRAGHDTFEVGEDEDGVFVANTDHGGHLMEWGSANNEPHAPLRQGARTVGLDVDEAAR